MLEIPVNTLGESVKQRGGRLSPQGKGKGNLFRFVSPTKTSPTSENIEDRLKSAEKRKQALMKEKSSPAKKRAERFSMKQFDAENQKKKTKNQNAQKMSAAVAKQQKLKRDKAKKAAGNKLELHLFVVIAVI
jgi:hypothetical protein